MRNLTYTLSPHSPPFAALTDPPKGGKRAPHGPCRSQGQHPDAREFYVDGLICTFVLSGSTEEPDNTNGSKSNHQHKRGFWRQVEMRNLTYTLSPHSPRSLRSLTPLKRGKKGAHGLWKSVRLWHFNSDARSFLC